ncbi:hypothetical protein NL50_16375 [Clostridium acetobutylicum]|nr:hypothetical protein NL50_16375 [Clostridium acetobutylicum]
MSSIILYVILVIMAIAAIIFTYKSLRMQINAIRIFKKKRAIGVLGVIFTVIGIVGIFCGVGIFKNWRIGEAILVIGVAMSLYYLKINLTIK